MFRIATFISNEVLINKINMIINMIDNIKD